MNYRSLRGDLKEQLDKKRNAVTVTIKDSIINNDGIMNPGAVNGDISQQKTLQEENMLAIKQEALRAINELPDNVDIEEIMYRLYILAKIRKSQQAIEKKQILSSDELKLEIETW
jgi:hypothetical protein